MEMTKFPEPNIRAMPKLLEKYRPVSAAQAMKWQLSGVLGFDSAYDTGDICVRHPNGDAEIVLDPSEEILRLINEGAELSYGSVVIPDETSKSLKGRRLDAGIVKQWTGFRHTPEQAPENPFLQILARDNKLLERYTPKLSQLAKETYGYDKIMAVSVPEQRDRPVLNLWHMRSLTNGSDVSSHGALYGCGHLLGVAP